MLGLPRHRLAIGLAIASLAIQIPTRLLLVDRIPAVLEHADRVTTVGRDCANPFVLVSPAVFAGVERWTGFLAVGTALLVMALVILRLTDATAAMRRVLWPVLFGAIVALLVFAFNVLSFTLAINAPLTGALGWVLSLARASVPVGFLVGLLRMRMDKAAVATLVVGLHEQRRRDSLERSIATALHDPSVKLGYWSPAARVGSAGHGGQILLSEATRRRIEAHLPPEARLQPLGAFVLKGLPGLEPITQLTVPDLPGSFPALRLETPATSPLADPI